MNYAIETLEIERYKLISLRRQFFLYQSEGQVSFASEIKEVEEKLNQIESAIKKLGGK